LILSLILQSKLSIESSKGIYTVSLFPFPFLIINIITNDFPTINQLNKLNKYINLGDLIAGKLKCNKYNIITTYLLSSSQAFNGYFSMSVDLLLDIQLVVFLQFL